MELELKNKRVIIGGASRGIGLEIARSFLSEGANVGLIARDESILKKSINELKSENAKSELLDFTADLMISHEAENAIAYFAKHWDGIDILVTNVGDGKGVADAIPSVEDFEMVWNKNFRSAEHLIRASIPFLKISSGNIVIISSIAGLEVIGAPTAYSVSKSALVSLSKTLSRKLAPEIRVNCISPGNVFFPGGSWDEKLQDDPLRIQNLIASTVPMKRFGSTREIADAVLFLSSPRSGFTTGACLVVDGGQTVGY